MKTRWTTYLLLTAVAAVWGIVAWKIFAPTSGDGTVVAPQIVATKAPAAAADTLQLDYPDPFLKGAPRPVEGSPTVRPLPVAKPVPRRERVKIVHLGTVVSHGNPLYILTLGNQQYELIRGDQAEGFVLTACDRDSLYLTKEELIYGVKLCE